MATRDKIEKLRDLQNQVDDQLDGERERNLIKTQLKREEYKDEIRLFISEFTNQAEKNNIKNFDISFLGGQYTTRRDVIHLSWVITDVTEGKIDIVMDYCRLLMHETGLAEYFDVNSIFVNDNDGTIGQTVTVIVYRTDHEWIDVDPIDIVGKPDTDEGEDDPGGGGGW